MSFRAGARERLAYVHAILLEIKTISDAEKFGFLAHLLEMAYIQSGDMLRDTRPPPSPGKRRHWKSANTVSPPRDDELRITPSSP